MFFGIRLCLGFLFLYFFVFITPVVAAYASYNTTGKGLRYDVLRLFGLFNIRKADGTVIASGAQHLQAFLLAINDINSDTSLLPNYLLQFKVADAKSSFFTACVAAMGPAKLVTASPYYRALVTSIGNEYIEAAVSMLREGGAYKELFSMVTNAPTSLISKGSVDKYKGRIIPPDSYSGDVLRDILSNKFKYKRVAVFSTVSYFASLSTDSFMSDSNFDVLVKLSLQPGMTDYSNEIQEAKNSGSRVFIFLVDSGTAATLLVQGLASKMLDEGTIVFLHENAAVVDTIDTIKSQYPSVNIDQVTQGVMGIQRNARHSLYSTTKGVDFLKKWRAQPATAAVTPKTVPCSITSSVPQTCNCMVDTIPLSTVSVFYASSTCAGIQNFTTYTANTLDANVPYIYDGVYATAHALHYLLETQQLRPNATYPSAADIIDAMMQHVDFVGVTGRVTFGKGLYTVDGLPTLDIVGKGDRNSGFIYDITMYSSGSNSWETVGRWGGSELWQLCDELVDSERVGSAFACPRNVVYKSSTGLRPSDRYPDAIPHMSAGIIGFLLFLGAFGLFTVLLLALFLCMHRSTKHVRFAQPPMIVIVFIGETLAAIRVIVGTRELHNNPWVCNANLWLGHLAFIFCFTGLCLKMWRVDKIINAKAMARVWITDAHILTRAVAILLVAIALLIAVTVAGVPHIEETIQTIANTDYYIYECKQDLPAVEQVMFALEAVFLLWGIRLCIATKDAPSAVNESLIISIAAAIIIFISGIIIPIVYLVKLDPVAIDTLACFGFGFGQLLTTLCIFLPKVLSITLSDDDKIKGHGLKETEDGNSKSVTRGFSLFGSSTVKVKKADYELTLLQACAKAMQGLSPDDRFSLSQRQIEYWRGVLMAISDINSVSSSQYKNSSVVVDVDGDNDDAKKYVLEEFTTEDTAENIQEN